MALHRLSGTWMIACAVLVLAVLHGGAGVSSAAAAGNVPALSVLSTTLIVRGDGRPDTLIVYGELPAGTPLPATLSLAVPSGAKPDWAGEILGGDPAQDPTATYTTTPAPGYDVVAVTLTRAVRGQVEIDVPAKAAGTNTTYRIAQPIIGPVSRASLAFEVPTGSTVFDQSPGLTKDSSANGFDRYTVTISNPEPDSEISASLTASVAAAPAQAPSNGPQSPLAGQPPQGQTAGQTSGGSALAAGTSGSPWMTVAVAAAFAFFVYNLLKYRRVRALERDSGSGHSQAGKPRSGPIRRGGPASEAGGPGVAHHRARRGGGPVAGNQDDDFAPKLKELADSRSRHELSREEFLARRTELLAGQRHT